MQITEGGEAVAKWLEDKLLVSLRQTNTQAENLNIILAAKDSEDHIVGGLVASTSYGWLLIKVLWVESNCRGSGIGQSLVEEAELTSLTRGCHGAWLDTSNAAAYEFYLRLGYETFGELCNSNDQSPAGHRRWFMKKSLNLHPQTA